MENKLTEKQLKYLNDDNFHNMYTELLVSRMTHSNMSIEHDLGDIDESNNAIKLINNMQASKILFENYFSPLTEELIILVANTINKDSIYISDGYRKVGETLEDTGLPISLPENIKSDMEKLLDDYNNKWKDLNVFEKEALFNIRFLGIHPFEDGKGRTSRLILNFNVMKQGYAPIIMTESIREEYFDARNREDTKWIKNLFERLSSEEFLVLNKLIDIYSKEKESSKIK